MKPYFINETKKEINEKKVSEKKKTTADIIATKVQRDAIFALEHHVFGSKEEYFKFRESGKDFPGEYKAAKNFILNYPWGTAEYFEKFISGIPTLEESNGYKLTGKFISKKYSEGERLPKKPNPKSFQTYKSRVSSFQSRLRKQEYSESIIKEMVNVYTDSYNTKFNTNFDPYYSKSYK